MSPSWLLEIIPRMSFPRTIIYRYKYWLNIALVISASRLGRLLSPIFILSSYEIRRTNSFTNVFPRVSTNTTENPKFRCEVQHLHFRVGVVYLRFQPEARTISTLKIGVEIKSRALK
eukprot:sb/3476480/